MHSCGNHIAASCKFLAFNCELGGKSRYKNILLDGAYDPSQNSSLKFIHLAFMELYAYVAFAVTDE